MYERKINYDDMLNDLDSFEANVPNKRAGSSSSFNLDSLVDNIDSLIEKAPAGHRSKRPNMPNDSESNHHRTLDSSSTIFYESSSKSDYNSFNSSNRNIPQREHLPVDKSSTFGVAKSKVQPKRPSYKEQSSSKDYFPPRAHPPRQHSPVVSEVQ